MSRKVFSPWIALAVLIAIPMDAGFAQWERGGSDAPPQGFPNNRVTRNLKLLKHSFEETQKDVARLYELATELKQETEQASADEFSLAIVKQAEEIEKLAKRIKNRMKNL